MVAVEGISAKIVNGILSYDTVKIVTIKNKKVGILHRILQIIILGYVVGYAIIWKKGYQESDTAMSAVTTKLKGTALVNFTGFKSSLFNGVYVFDSADYVIPAQANNEFFVMTNMIVTPKQTRGRCPEDPSFARNRCISDKDCIPGKAVSNGNGVKTGKCVASDQNKTINVCEIYAWCPVELNVLPMPGHGFRKGVPLLEDAANFTVLIKNQVTFPKFGVSRRNILKIDNAAYLNNCLHNHKSDPLCPVFKLGKIVKDAGYDFNQIAYEGGIIAIDIRWDCNLDRSGEHCRPVYSFKRLDDPNAPIGSGFNFRSSQFYEDKEEQHRILYKAYGIKFEILVSGQAGKFSPVPLFLNLGSGIALLGIATIGCDIIVMHFLKDKRIYRNHKYHVVEHGNGRTDSDDEAGLYLTNISQEPFNQV